MNEKQLNEERVQSGRTMNDQHKRIGQLESELAEAQATAEGYRLASLKFESQVAALHRVIDWLDRYFAQNVDGGGKHGCPYCYASVEQGKWLNISHSEGCPFDAIGHTAAAARRHDAEAQAQVEKQKHEIAHLQTLLDQQYELVTERTGQVAALTDALLTQLDNTAGVVGWKDEFLRVKNLLADTAAVAAEHDAAVRKQTLLEAADFVRKLQT